MKNLDFTNKQSTDVQITDNEILYDIKLNFRLLRKRFNKFKRKISKKIFTEILIVTTGECPIDFIQAVKKQYPDKNFSVLIPIIGNVSSSMSKIGTDFDYFLQNKKHSAQLYKYPLNEDNINIYGIFSETFSKSCGIDYTNIMHLSSYAKCLRHFAKKLNPDIIQIIDIPYFWGIEFEKEQKTSAKIYQIIKDFSKYQDLEPFWACLNIIDKSGMMKLCNDKFMKKYIASLFKIKNINSSAKMYECLELIYNNYTKFRKSIESIEDIEENRIFKRLNSRILKLFPQINIKDSEYINPMHSSLKKCDFWSVYADTYYGNIFTNNELTGSLFNIINKTKSKSSPVSIRADFSKHKICTQFNKENFREKRNENKKYLLKEFSQNRIKTNFTDISLFENEDYKIYGYLDYFLESPLIFCSLKPFINEYGIDTAFSTILKLFELNKNIQAIFNIPNGMKNEYIKKFVNFCENTSTLNGKWLFLDGKLNLPQFVSSSDIVLFPYRKNIVSELPLMAIHYGCVPVVSNIGFLNDLVIDIYDDMENGCGFKTNYLNYNTENAEIDFLTASIKCINFYKQNHTGWNIIVKNALNTCVHWDFEIIEKYNNIYEDIL